jgi:hypothetical protein
VAYGLAEKVEHAKIEIVLFDLSVADLEVMEQRHD